MVFGRLPSLRWAGEQQPQAYHDHVDALLLVRSVLLCACVGHELALLFCWPLGQGAGQVSPAEGPIGAEEFTPGDLLVSHPAL
jgi:hypothetical protein